MKVLLLASTQQELDCFYSQAVREYQHLELQAYVIGVQCQCFDDLMFAQIITFGPDVALLVGSCGGVGEHISTGCIAVPAMICCADSADICVSKWHHQLALKSFSTMLPVCESIYCSQHFVVSVEDKKNIASQGLSSFVDMESYPVAKLLSAMNLPLIIIKVVIDSQTTQIHSIHSYADMESSVLKGLHESIQHSLDYFYSILIEYPLAD